MTDVDYVPVWELDPRRYYAECRPGPAFYPNVRRGRPVYLSGVLAGLDQLEQAGYDVGVLLQPKSTLEEHAGRFRYWAADNGCFSELFGKGFDEHRWFDWLAGLSTNGRLRWGCWGFDHESRVLDTDDALEPMGCLFATAPDVVCDMAATWERSLPWFQKIRQLGFPVALVAQNGLESFAPAWDECDRWDCLFIGGGCPHCMESTRAARKAVKCGRRDHADWKLSDDARDCVHEAQLHSKFVHMGRVNSGRRLRTAASWDCDSADGTFLRFGAPDDMAAQVAAWLDGLATDPEPRSPTWRQRFDLPENRQLSLPI